MSASNTTTAKPQDSAPAASGSASKETPASAPTALEEDDEFEDFPVDGRRSDFVWAGCAGVAHRMVAAAIAQEADRVGTRRLATRGRRGAGREQPPLGGELGRR